MSFDSSGTMHVSRPCTRQLYTVHLGTGAVTLVGPAAPDPANAVAFSTIGIAFDSSGVLFLKDDTQTYMVGTTPPGRWGRSPYVTRNLRYFWRHEE